ncbi:MAG: hypothetical protein ABI837_16145 [Acidobacteriota bacterium]
MSKKNNVNPNFYKDGGRENTEGADKGDVYETQKQALRESEHETKMQGKRGQPNFIPGQSPVGEPGRSSSSRKPK